MKTSPLLKGKGKGKETREEKETNRDLPQVPGEKT